MDNLLPFIIAVLVIGVIAYLAIWAFSTDYFLDDTANFDVWRGVIAAVIFAIVLILLLYWASNYYAEW